MKKQLFSRTATEEWRLLMEMPVKDPMKFEPIEHDRAEWDNIPSIIVRMCLNSHRYLQSTIAYLAQKNYEIRSLQHDVGVIPGQMEQMRKEINAEFSNHADEIKGIKEHLDKIYKEIEEMKNLQNLEKSRL